MTQLTLDGRYSDTAKFSACKTWRYLLTRELGGDSMFVSFGLNPSVADAKRNDPTVRKDIGFAKRWGLGRVVKLNAYGYVATDPDDLHTAGRDGIDIVGPENNQWIRDTLWLAKGSGGRVVVSWGNHIESERQEEMWSLITDAGIEPLCFGVNKNGTPKHELYMPYDCELVPWRLP